MLFSPTARGLGGRTAVGNKHQISLNKEPRPLRITSGYPLRQALAGLPRASPNSTAQETQAFLRALELRIPTALGESPHPHEDMCFIAFGFSARSLNARRASKKGFNAVLTKNDKL